MPHTDISPGHCTCQAVQPSVHILPYQNIGTVVPAPLLTLKFQFHLPEARGQGHTSPTSSGSDRQGKSDRDFCRSPEETERAPSPRQRQSPNQRAETLDHTLCAQGVTGVRQEPGSSGSCGHLVAALLGGSSTERHRAGALQHMADGHRKTSESGFYFSRSLSHTRENFI